MYNETGSCDVLWARGVVMFWCCLKIEWFGITAINISLSFDGDPGGGRRYKFAHELHLGQQFWLTFLQNSIS